MNRNIAYQTQEIAEYFSTNRINWDQFYDSERHILEQIGISSSHRILDIGCGCGGLGLVLKEKFGTTNYTGIEINPSAVESARIMNPSAQILLGDFLDLSKSEIFDKFYDVVFSLSCFDWNIEFDRMLNQAWSHVAPGGVLVATFRLVVEDGCNDMNHSYQFINFKGEKSGEKAAYIVLNAKVLFEKLISLDPVEISAFGYFGKPSRTAITPFNEICFAAFSIRKSSSKNHVSTKLNLQLPAEIISSLGSLK
jgi:SAM-dependent methyltransferase